jgi:glutamate synthase (NADPH/NADH) large chain
MYAYCNSVMEPWDGPAALAMTDGRWVCGGLDRNGLRPMRYVLTGDGMLIAGSEAGMVPVDDMTVREKGALGPGQMIAVDMAEGKLYRDWELKDMLAASQPFGDWVEKVVDLNAIMENVPEKALYEGADLRRRQIAAGYTLEELEQVLAPMAEDGKEMVASMGDDTPPRFCRRSVSAAVALLPPELQPGDQPADRQPARKPGDEPQDPVRQPDQRARRGFQPDRDSGAGKPVHRQCRI